MIQTCTISGVMVVGMVLGGAGCESKTTPPPVPAPVSSSSGQGLNNLASNPKSLLGKSAAAGRNAAAGIQNQQDIASNAANQISGQAATEFVIGGLKFAIPEGWKSVTPSSSMVKATYLIESAGAQVNFSTAGGDVGSNLDRWKKQITNGTGEPVEGEVVESTAIGFKVVIYKATGTYASMTGGKQANTSFRGAIIKMPVESVFVRLTGPAEKMGQVEGAWEQMVMGLAR